MDIDQYFAKPMKQVRPFVFDEGVAQVFDDMVSRSVPFYNEIHRILCEISAYQIQAQDLIYDLGCSTGTTIEILSKHLWDKKIKFVGVDNSAAMIEKAQAKLESIWHPYKLLTGDIQKTEFLKQSAGLVIMNYTLQFIDRELRKDIVKNVYDSLRVGGMFFMAEKIDANETGLQNLLTDLYYDFKKRNGYSELEIAQKREALERVLVPNTADQQIQLLKEAGFSKVEMIFRWYNFATFIGIK